MFIRAIFTNATKYAKHENTNVQDNPTFTSYKLMKVLFIQISINAVYSKSL